METKNIHKIGTLAFGVALALAAIPGSALAQVQPSYASPAEDTVHGRIVSIDDQYNVSVRDNNGYVDHVQLHQGTIINPTGLSLHPGMAVTILGVNQGSVLAANEIDTPYEYVPGYVYGPRPYVYPSVAIGFGFGGYGRWR